MVQEFISQWEKNKDKLKQYFSTKHPDSYLEIVKQLFLLVISGFNVKNLTVLDHGDFEGTQIYIIPKDIYQPCTSDYVFTHNYYGSCSGSGTLEGIRESNDNKPKEKQVRDYMQLALNLVQKLKYLSAED
jgi:hypothetical protein